ncbi:MAG: TM2 domain-containing protein [Nitrospiraceae bacterium]
MFSTLHYVQGLTESQRAIFNIEFDRVAKKRNTILWLTLLLGGLGAHHFYLERKGLGILYLLFSWTFIPLIVAFFELFVVMDRVDRFNDKRAQEIVDELRMFR